MSLNKRNLQYQTTNRVILFSHNSNLSGAPIALAQLARKIPRFGFSPLFLLPKPGPLIEILKNWGIEYRVLRRSISIFDFIRIVRKENPVLIHVNSLVKTWPVLVSRLVKKPVIWHVHEYLDNKIKYAQFIHFLADRVILISHEQYDLFKDMRKAILITDGIDNSLFEDTCPAKILPNNCGAQTTVVYIGTIEPRKGLIILAQAATILNDRSWIHYLVVGEAPKKHKKYKQKVQDIIRKNGLSNRFHFLGYRKDVPKILFASDFLCHPAYIEVFGLVVLEAMSSERAVITTRIGEMSNIIDEGKTGLIVQQGDPESLANAIALLDSNKELCKQMGKAGKLRAKQLFDINVHAQKVANIYKEMKDDS